MNKIDRKKLSVEAQERIDEARESDSELSPEELRKSLGLGDTV